MGEVETAHVDRPAAWGVLESLRSVGESFPVEQHWSVSSHVSSEELFTYESHANTSRANILLGTGVDETVFVPVDFSCTEV
jgi:hypothetical protein